MMFKFLKYDIKRYYKLFFAATVIFFVVTLFKDWVNCNNALHASGNELYLEAINFSTAAAVIYSVFAFLYLGYYVLTSTLGKTVSIVRLCNYSATRLLVIRVIFSALVLSCVFALCALTVSIPAIAYKINRYPLYISNNFDYQVFIWSEFGHLKILQLFDWTLSFVIILAVAVAVCLWLKGQFREHKTHNIIISLLIFISVFVVKAALASLADGSALDLNSYQSYALYPVYFMTADSLNMVSAVLNIILTAFSVAWFSQYFYRTEL